MFTLRISARAQRELRQIKRIHQQALLSIFEEIKEDPLLGKPLTQELTRRFSFRVGVYRIIYKVNVKDKIIYILTAGHRGKVYRS